VISINSSCLLGCDTI